MIWKAGIKSKNAFTIVELAIAMAFISFLILAIGTVTTQISQIYQKGLTLKSVNDTGREISDEFIRAINAAKLIGEYEATPSGNFDAIKTKSRDDTIYMKLTEDIFGDGTSVPVYGAFCTGKDSYVWNSGYIVKTNPLKYKTIPSSSDSSYSSSMTDGTPFYLLHIKNDSEKNYCKTYDPSKTPGGMFPPSLGGGLEIKEENNITVVTELLSPSEDNLALYDLTIFPTKYHEATKNSFVSGTFILGTVTGDPKKDVNILTSENICSGHPSDNFTTDFVYCSINKFNFAATAIGKD